MGRVPTREPLFEWPLFAPLREISVSIGLPRRSLAKAGVHPPSAVALLRRTGPWFLSVSLRLCGSILRASVHAKYIQSNLIKVNPG